MVSAYALGNLADAADPNYNLGDLGGREALDELLVPYSDQARAPARTYTILPIYYPYTIHIPSIYYPYTIHILSIYYPYTSPGTSAIA